MLSFFVIIAAYLLGSIPVGYLIVRASTGGADVRATGSGGTGATNVSRSAGKGAGIVTLILDALKGSAAVLLALSLADPRWTPTPLVAWAMVAAVAGHVFPVWLKFRGGKGVATGLGVFAVLVPLATVIAAAVFVVVVWRTKYVSLGSIIAAATVPLLTWLIRSLGGSTNEGFGDHDWWIVAGVTIVSLLVIFMHRANINRLLAGTENRLR